MPFVHGIVVMSDFNPSNTLWVGNVPVFVEADGMATCPLCSKRFLQHTLIRHYKQHHAQQWNKVEDTCCSNSTCASNSMPNAAVLSAAAARCVSFASGDSSASRMPAQADGARQQLLHRLATARVVNHVPRDVVEDFKKAAAEYAAALKEDLLEKLRADSTSSVHEIISNVFDAAMHMGRRDAEMDALRASKGYVKPCPPRPLVTTRGGKNNEVIEEHVAYDCDFDRTLEQMFRDPDIWEDVASFMERLKGRLCASPEFKDDLVIEDMIDGSEFGKFMLRMRLKNGETPLVFMFYYDGLEVVNGLGQARVTHELACFYWALVNVRPERRLSSKNIRLATVCLKRAVSAAGMAAIINGDAGVQSSVCGCGVWLWLAPCSWFHVL